MKKWLASLLSMCTAFAALTPNMFAAIGGETLIVGSQRILAYWTLGLCSVAFFALVAIWSWRLRSNVKSQPDRHQALIMSQRQK